MVKVIPPKPNLCDLCLEKKEIMMWNEDEEQWVCIECMNDLLEERKRLEDNGLEYIDEEDYS